LILSVLVRRKELLLKRNIVYKTLIQGFLYNLPYPSSHLTNLSSTHFFYWNCWFQSETNVNWESLSVTFSRRRRLYL